MQQCEREAPFSSQLFLQLPYSLLPANYPYLISLQFAARDSSSCGSLIFLNKHCCLSIDMCMNIHTYVHMCEWMNSCMCFLNFIHRFTTAHISLAQGWHTRCRLFTQSILSHSHHKTRGCRQLSVHCQEWCWIYIEWKKRCCCCL